MTVIRAFSVSDGVIAAERLPEQPDQLYATPQELGEAFGVRASEAQIRHAMAIIHSVTNRPSIWPVEYEFNLRLPSDRYESRIPVTPVLKITEASGRYSYGSMRRDRQGIGAWYWGYGAMLALQGAAPQMVAINEALIQYDPSTGIFALPWSNMLLGAYNEVRIRSICGYVEIPGRIKVAIVELINNVSGRGISDRIAYSVGKISRKYASNSFVTPEAERLLQPFIVAGMY